MVSYDMSLKLNKDSDINLVVIIPCLNEEKTIGNVISRIPQKIDGVAKIDIFIVDDGSTDNTIKIAQQHNVRVISHQANRGVGAAFQSGISKALETGADIIVNMDGDGQFNPEDIPRLINPIIEGKADFVTASRFKDKNLIPEMPAIKKWGNKNISKLISLLVGNKFYDVSCGFRAYSQEAALNLNLFGKFTYTHETFLDLAFKDVKIMEVPLKVHGVREFGKSRVADNLWKYGINTFKIIFRTYRDYKPMAFFGFLSIISFCIALGLGIFFFAHYFLTGRFSPHLWSGFLSGFMIMLGFLLFITGLLADMLDRIRKNQEEIIYYEKRRSIKSRK